PSREFSSRAPPFRGISTRPAAGMARSPPISTTGTATRTGPRKSAVPGKRRNKPPTLGSGGLRQRIDAGTGTPDTLLGLEPRQQGLPVRQVLLHQVPLHLVQA